MVKPGWHKELREEAVHTKEQQDQERTDDLTKGKHRDHCRPKSLTSHYAVCYMSLSFCSAVQIVSKNIIPYHRPYDEPSVSHTALWKVESSWLSVIEHHIPLYM